MYLCGLKEVCSNRSERTSYIHEVKVSGKAIITLPYMPVLQGLATCVPHVRDPILLGGLVSRTTEPNRNKLRETGFVLAHGF